MGDNQEWYDNKALYEKIQQLQQDLADIRKEMAETRAIIRDYNGLRKAVNDTAGKINMLLWLIPIVIAGTGLLFTALNFILK
ncbi:hypothetical protein [Mahella australiensis]|uniref:Uncharacterized protein n=1 Tax=Mahella australiensis (strain DSM 15567 / CIP 107919 / 50-1 BON) TaxID=697281 RepID=F4A0F6_MAHA5|nr:hypothetical protein [Mahella australiensis]AEE98017.1 hypothetical protein Mahau_2895 [Mahella australiensis 50-1 BON]